MPQALVSYKERPVINSMYMPSPHTPAPRSFDLNTLMYWIKKTPECIGILKRISNDIVTPISFSAIESQKKPGRPASSYQKDKIDVADYFAKNNVFSNKALASVIDWAATGDNYLWKAGHLDKTIKETANKHYADFGIELKEIDLKQFYDEDYNGISSIEILPSTMTRIEHDSFKIIRYTQEDKQHPGIKRKFSPEEIVHGKYLDIDGSVYGYSRHGTRQYFNRAYSVIVFIIKLF